MSDTGGLPSTSRAVGAESRITSCRNPKITDSQLYATGPMWSTSSIALSLRKGISPMAGRKRPRDVIPSKAKYLFAPGDASHRSA